MVRILSVLVILLAFVLFLSTRHRTLVIADPSLAEIQVASVQEAIDPDTGVFAQTGTLVFYPNNVKPVPYLFYQDEDGTTVAKALVFDALPSTDFSVWSGARVSVFGTVSREHVLVNRIEYLASP